MATDKSYFFKNNRLEVWFNKGLYYTHDEESSTIKITQNIIRAK